MRIALTLAALLSVTLAAGAQGAPAPPASRSIHLDVTVVPKSGPPVAGLAQQDFTLLDNKTPRSITSFKAVTSAQEPVEFIVLIDAVNMPFTEVSYVRKQLQDYLQANPHLPYPTSVGLVTDKGAQVATGFTSDGKAIAEFLGQLPTSVRTFVDDNGFYVAQQRMQICLTATRQILGYARSLPGRKVVVWISPGWPLLSESDTRIDDRMQNFTFTSVVSMAAQMRQARLTFYAINPLGATEATSQTFSYQQYVHGLDKSVHAKAGDLGLQVLSVQSGGIVFTGKTDILAQLQQTFDDAANWYELTFDAPPAEHPDEYHHIDIKIDKPGLIARTRDGFYDQP